MGDRMTQRYFRCDGYHGSALTCIGEADAGNICERFYDECHRPEVCPYSRGPPFIRQEASLELAWPSRRLMPCRIYAANGGHAMPAVRRFRATLENDGDIPDSLSERSAPALVYCYGFSVIVGDWCKELNCCLDRFLRRLNLRYEELPMLSYSTQKLRELTEGYKTEQVLGSVAE